MAEIGKVRELMKFIESRLLGVQIDKTGRTVLLSIIDAGGTPFTLTLHGVERLLINELRQQNIIEEMTHWSQGMSGVDLRAAAFFLMTGGSEEDCGQQLATVANTVVDRVVRGELEVMEITAIFGAQILASFASMTIQSEI
jgi:hypothetical protein